MRKWSVILGIMMVSAVTICADSMSLVDSAVLRNGTHADTAQSWSASLALKNAGNDYGRIAMMKADISLLSGAVDSATFNVYATDFVAATLYIYGVVDSASFQNWTGGSAGSATWNSVTTDGLFTPQQDLHLATDPNMVLLGTQALSGANAGDVQVSVSGSALVSLLNSDTDGRVTFVFAVAENVNSGIRPHNHTSAPSLNVTYGASPVITETTGPTGLKHPGCLQSAVEINSLAVALAENDPYRTSLWSSMMSNTRGRIDKTNWIPPTDLFGTDFADPAKYAGAGLIRYVNDWIINGTPSSEASAITILNTWAGVQSFTADSSDNLKHHRLVSMWLGYLAHAADLLISSGTSWPVAERDAFKDTVRDILLPIANDDRAAKYNGNWDLGATWAVMSMAVLLDDKVLFDEQIAWLKDGDTNARISNYLLASGQNQESSRDQTHASMGLTFLSFAVQTAWSQGIDLYEYDNRSVGKAFEYYAAYNLGEDHLRYQVYPAPLGSSSHGFSTAISADQRPQFFDVFEMVYHHYKNYRGIELPFCKTVLETVTRPEEPGSNWSNHNSALYWGLDLSADAALRQAQSANVDIDIDTNYAGRAFLRINCGGDAYHMASDGRAFSMDRSEWNDGGSDLSHANAVAGTAEAGLYQAYREGDLSGSIYYHFDLPNGEYNIQLHFAEPDFSQAGQRRFNVDVEGNSVDNLDIYAEAGSNTAIILEGNIVLADGQLDVELESIVGRPLICAIEIEPRLLQNTAPVANSDSVSVDENSLVAITLSGSDADGDPLTYSVETGPVNGSLSGTAPNLTYTPSAGYTGADGFAFSANDGMVNSAVAMVSITVNDVNGAPVFTSDPVVKGGAVEDAVYGDTIAGSATDGEGGMLTYSRISGPSWLSIASAGALSGTPGGLDVGLNSWMIQVSDGSGGTDLAMLEIAVTAVNDAPVFVADPIIGASASEDAAYNGSLAGSATDEESDSLTYFRVSGPAWLGIASDGALSGTPSQADVGLNSWIVQVSDGDGGADTATLEITVATVNDAPVWNDNPVYSPDANEDVAYSKYLNWRVTDEEGDGLTFAKVSGPAWLNISNNSYGKMTGTPAQADAGNNTFVVSVMDGISAPVEVTMYINVLNVNDAPVYTADPIIGTGALEDAAYSDTLAGSATDEDGGSLIYSKVSGPAWLSVAADGALAGVPSGSDVGLNSFVVKVDDGNDGFDTALLEITVIAAPVGWAELSYTDFEAGWGDWVSAGADAFLSSDFAVGSQSLNLQDNSGGSEAELSKSLDLTGYSELKIEFSYAVQSFESSEDFWVRFSFDDGATWSTIRAYVNDVDFVDDGTRYDSEVVVDSGSYAFSDSVRIMFECDASGDRDDVYIDNVRVSVR